MKIYRQIFGKIDTESMKANLEEILKEDLGWGYFSKNLEEESNEYNLLKSYINVYNLHDSAIDTEFTKEEVYDSEILCFRGGRPFSYPEPQEPKFLDNTYLNSCYECGTHGEQKADFVIKKDPSLKLNSVGTLHWVFGELFSEKSLYDNFFSEFGLDMRPVKISKTDRFASSVVQVVIPELKYNLNMKNLEHSVCSQCGIVKYIAGNVGFFPVPEDKDISIVRTKEFFGSGHSAHNKVLLNNGIMQEMTKRKIAKVHQFTPCR